MTTRVFKYGARLPRPRAGEHQRLRQHLRSTHRYFNLLVQAENARRQRLWGGDRPPKPPHNDCKCDECKAHWKEVRDRVYAKDTRLDVRALRAWFVGGGGRALGYHPTEAAFSAAIKKTKPTRLLKFRSWRQGSEIAIQISPRARQDLWFRVTDVGKRSRALIELRIDSASRKPVWSDPIPFIMHRPLAGDIRWVKVNLSYVADREVWSVSFVCTNIEEDTNKADRGVVAIDVGWRQVDNGTRIAYARGDDGREFEFLLPPSWAALAVRADELRGLREQRVNELKAADSRFSRVRSPRGVARVASREQIDIRSWLYRDRHLWRYEAGLRRRSRARRVNDMRVWLHHLRQEYGEVVIKDSRHKEMKETKNLPKPARRRGHHAAPGSVIEAIKRYWDQVWVVKGAGTSMRCVACGESSIVGAEMIIHCEQCGDDMDRDSRSTRNMLHGYACGDARPPAARKTTARFAKRHKDLSEPSQRQLDAL